MASLPVPGCLLNGVGVGASMVRRPTDVPSYPDPVPGQTRAFPYLGRGEEDDDPGPATPLLYSTSSFVATREPYADCHPTSEHHHAPLPSGPTRGADRNRIDRNGTNF